jgi:hypothetical protein
LCISEEDVACYDCFTNFMQGLICISVMVL